MSQTRKYLPQSVKNQVSAATFADDIRGPLNQLVNPNTGEQRGPIKTIIKPRTHQVREYTSDFPRSKFVSDPKNYHAPAHKMGQLRLTRRGVPLTKYFSKGSPTKGGSKKRSYKKSGKNSHKKSHKRRHS